MALHADHILVKNKGIQRDATKFFWHWSTEDGDLHYDDEHTQGLICFPIFTEERIWDI